MADLSKDEDLGSMFASQASAPNSSASNLANDPDLGSMFGSNANNTPPRSLTDLANSYNKGMMVPSIMTPASALQYQGQQLSQTPFGKDILSAYANAIIPELGIENFGLNLLSKAGIYGGLNASLGAWKNPDNPVYNGAVQGALGAASSALPDAYGLTKAGLGFLRNSLTKNIPTENRISINQIPSLNGLFKQNSSWGGYADSQLGSENITLPYYLNSDPEQSASQLMQNLSNGERPEQAAINLASHIRNTYSNVRNNAQQKFDSLFDMNNPNSDIWDGYDLPPEAIGESSIYKNQYSRGRYGNLVGYQPNQYSGENLLDSIGNEIDSNSSQESKYQPFSSQNLNELHSDFIENPTVQNAHNLQSELGGEIGYLKTQRSKGNLDNQGLKDLFYYNNARNALNEDIENALNDISPSLSSAYSAAKQNWKQEVIPYRSDQDLYDIAQGKILNPKPSQISSIFGYPEPSIQKVSGDLGTQGNNRIAYLGLNKLPEENSSIDLLSAQKSLEKKGLSRYLSPEINQGFNDLNSNVRNSSSEDSLYQQIQNQISRANQQFSQQRNPFSVRQDAENESNQILRSGLAKQNDLLNPVQPEVTPNALAAFIKKFGGHTLSGLIGHII